MEPTTDPRPYQPPIDRLLTLGERGVLQRAWHDYVAMGFTAEHVPELLRMAGDPDLHGAPVTDSRVYAPVHAWRTLGLLRAGEAAAPLVELLVRFEDDMAREDLPRVLGMIGEPALEPVRTLLADASAALFTRIAAAHALEEIARRHSELRERAVELLTEQLEGWREQHDTLNAFLINDLVRLGATEPALLMEEAFAAHAVDESVCGDWEDVMVDLSLVPERMTSRPSPWTGLLSTRNLARAGARPPAGGKPHDKAKSRRKAEKQARKRNRRK